LVHVLRLSINNEINELNGSQIDYLLKINKSNESLLIKIN